METKDARCTNCGAHLNLEPQKTMVKCEYCQSTIMVSNAIELALVEVDHSKEIKKYRENLAQAIKQNNVEELKRISQNIRDLIPNDFEALYYYAYSLSVEGKMRLIREFYNNPPVAPQEKIDEVIDHISRYSDFRDKKLITTLIKQNAPEKLEAYEKEYAQRIQIEEQYAQVPRDVFICFSQIDLEVAFKVVETLENDGYTCWISSRNLRPNDSENYWKNIEKAIQQSQLFLVISSQSSMISKDVQREIEIAQEKNKRMFEYKIDASPHTLFFKHAFNGIKWVDGIVDPVSNSGKITSRLFTEFRIIKQERTTSSQADDVSTSQLKKNNRKKFKYLTAIASIIIISIASFFILRQNSVGDSEVFYPEIAMITDGHPNPTDDNFLNQYTWQGIELFTLDTGKNAQYYEPDALDLNATMQAVADAVDDGAEIIIGSGIRFHEAVWYSQTLYPETNFVVLDGAPIPGDQSGIFIEDNTTSIWFDESEAGFLAGYAAVMEGHRSFGFMGGFSYVEKFVYFGIGFIAGTHYAAYQIGVDIDFPNERYVYLESIEASDEIERLAESWYASGTEVIFSAGMWSIESIVIAAEKYDKYVIGSETDKSYLSEVVLTSAVYNLEMTTYDLLNLYYQDNLLTGSSAFLDIRNAGVSLTLEQSNFVNFTEDDYDQIIFDVTNRRLTIPEFYDDLNEFLGFTGFTNPINRETVAEPLN